MDMVTQEEVEQAKRKYKKLQAAFQAQKKEATKARKSAIEQSKAKRGDIIFNMVRDGSAYKDAAKKVGVSVNYARHLCRLHLYTHYPEREGRML
jgi:hypothetical protein